MIKKRKFSLIAIGLFLLAGLLSSADIDYKKFSGYWIGYGSSMQKVADDPFRKVTRRSETQFWFVVNEDGSISGEGEDSGKKIGRDSRNKTGIILLKQHFFVSAKIYFEYFCFFL